jgi:hypothetical protein
MSPGTADWAAGADTTAALGIPHKKSAAIKAHNAIHLNLPAFPLSVFDKLIMPYPLLSHNYITALSKNTQIAAGSIVSAGFLKYNSSGGGKFPTSFNRGLT